MKIEMIDSSDLAVRVNCRDCTGWKILGRLSSLALIAFDCSFQSVSCELSAELPANIRSAVDRFFALNPIIKLDETRSEECADDEFGFVVLGREEGFVCLRNAANENSYSIYLAALEKEVDLAARCSYLMANVLGLTSLLSYEIRFGVYELLNNLIEHGAVHGSNKWVQLNIEKAINKIRVSIVDKGGKFDPTGNDSFDLDNYLSSNRKRGLGLILTRKIANHMEYERISGYNNVSFEKSLSSAADSAALKGEGKMAQLIVGEPRLLPQGHHLIPLEGDIDTKGALVMEDLLNQLLEQRMLNIVLDFEKVPFVSSAGVGILLGMVNTLRDEGGDVLFKNISPRVSSVFRLLNLDDFFTIAESEEIVR